MKPYQKTDHKRNKKIIEYRQKGYSLRAIGGIFHLSQEGVAKIIRKYGKSYPQFNQLTRVEQKSKM